MQVMPGLPLEIKYAATRYRLMTDFKYIFYYKYYKS